MEHEARLANRLTDPVRNGPTALLHGLLSCVSTCRIRACSVQAPRTSEVLSSPRPDFKIENSEYLPNRHEYRFESTFEPLRPSQSQLLSEP
jgi:hypothetical protein